MVLEIKELKKMGFMYRKHNQATVDISIDLKLGINIPQSICNRIPAHFLGYFEMCVFLMDQK